MTAMTASPPRGLDSPQSKFIIKWMSRARPWLYKKTNGKVGGKFLKGASVALVTTIGRKSGEPRVSSVALPARGRPGSSGGIPGR